MESKTTSHVGGFVARVERFLGRVHYRRMETDAEMDSILRLRYDAYLREGAVSERPDRRLPDQYGDLDNAVNIGVFVEGSLVSAFRTHALTKPDDHSPSMDVFSDLLLEPLRAGKRIVDSNRFVTSHAASRAYPELPYVTVRLSVMASAHYKADLSTAAVRVEHQAFYKRSFFAAPFSPPRDYPTLTKPLLLMLVDFAHSEEQIYLRNPFYRSTRTERETLFGTVGYGYSEREHLLEDTQIAV